MGQLLIRNLDDRVIATLRARATAAKRSLEAEARDALASAARLTPDEKIAMALGWQAASDAARVPEVPQKPGWELIREDRDTR